MSVRGPRPALAVLAAGLFWLQPPPVLPIPSRTGPDGPPRPFGVHPSPGRTPPRTSGGWARTQSRALLEGPFPRAGLARGVSDGGELLSESEPVRTLALTRIRSTGARIVRIPVNWRDVVRAQPVLSFDAGDPGSAEYRFGRVDAAVRSTVAAGLEPLLVVSHAPDFAEAPHRWPYAYPGSWSPSPESLGAFAGALARRYDGAFPDPLVPGGALPRVRLFQAWNEPNLPRYLEPQWIARHDRWEAFSPLMYRGLLNGFYAGVKAVEPTDVVIAAGLAPNGEREGLGRMAPVRFLRAFLCLTGRPSGRAACPDPPHFDVLA
ncbi:MAG TPA: hypothetical protein VGX16_02490, partial [Solirubrobacteraceae bacterium]|nr:hypothetical protein [Solirubrobacteraceae bacterium]